MFNRLDRILKKAAKEKKKNLLIPWNRGLGDIALGLYALVHRIRTYIPDAKITFVTRSNLVDGFALLKDVSVIEAKEWRRGTTFQLDPLLTKQFDLVLDAFNPTRDLKWQRGKLIPKLEWNAAWDDLHLRFQLPASSIAVHLQTETGYAPGREWPLEKWKELFSRYNASFLLFGFEKTPPIEMSNVIDLRGKTALYEMLSIIKNCCSTLIVPDSGVLSFTYYLNVNFPLKVISLWSNPKMGVLKQNVASPNAQLLHLPLFGKKESAAEISVDKVITALGKSYASS